MMGLIQLYIMIQVISLYRTEPMIKTFFSNVMTALVELETYFYLDGSFGSTIPYTIFPDNARLGFGASADLNIHHDASHSYIDNEHW